VGTVRQSHVDPPLTDNAFDASGGGETNSGNDPRGDNNPDGYGSNNICHESTNIKTATTKEREDTSVEATTDDDKNRGEASSESDGITPTTTREDIVANLESADAKDGKGEDESSEKERSHAVVVAAAVTRRRSTRLMARSTGAENKSEGSPEAMEAMSLVAGKRITSCTDGHGSDHSTDECYICYDGGGKSKCNALIERRVPLSHGKLSSTASTSLWLTTQLFTAYFRADFVRLLS
jgi:hypothetical protein